VLWPLPLLIGTQLLFSCSDIMGSYFMSTQGFTLANLLRPWFLVYFAIRTVATFGQLYIFATMNLGKTMALFGAVSIMISNAFSILVLGHMLSPLGYVGVSLAVLTFLVLACS
jgi:drug/metabolite transporter superfamily protein YnfA